MILSSEGYGDEEFKYDTQQELLAGVARLLGECKKHARKDGLERDNVIRIGPSIATEFADLD